ncbi:uncharacterized protein A1O9_13061 [Exophiala aquamarina CBS 119918]|uniref:Methyltransferase domain-containing protein n=1 Tax=Exophiala aquamarina CBS 119918 TaxID=1182545 RepID=A0A072NTD5_9EURO|nr:uncharacterized protein A1O9_13061 [Exophiala aquamarina CBS 119918]KEF50891.1 hypothetical protein A1O9_13061 [Exophiala aquamarina CBS 119918]
MASTNPRDGYLLGRDILAESRLYAQHYLFTERAGGLLNADIVKDVGGKTSMEILDVGCGNGIWALDVAQAYPGTKVVGTDISSAQFPPAWTWPKDCVFTTVDVLEPVPQQYVGRFDVANARMVAGNLHGCDMNIFLGHLLRMLKPGGWIQCLDLSLPVVCAHDDEDPQAQTTWKRPPTIATQLLRISTSIAWLEDLPTRMKSGGFAVVREYDCPPRRSQFRHETVNFLSAMVEMSRGVRSIMAGDIVDEFDEAVEELHRDVRDGRLFHVGLKVRVGKKAS